MAKKREKPKMLKKQTDIEIFGAAYSATGFGKPPCPKLMGWLAEYCDHANPFEVGKGMLLRWQSHEYGDGFIKRKETPSRQNGSNTWTGCYCRYEVPRGRKPPPQWYNQLPDVQMSRYQVSDTRYQHSEKRKRETIVFSKKSKMCSNDI